MQKVFCDVCKKELVHEGKYFRGEQGKLVFLMEAGYEEMGKGDVCLFCLCNAVTKSLMDKLKRKYTRKEKLDKPVDLPTTPLAQATETIEGEIGDTDPPQVLKLDIPRKRKSTKPDEIDLSTVQLDALNSKVKFQGKEWTGDTLAQAIVYLLTTFGLVDPAVITTYTRIKEIITEHCTDPNTLKILLANFGIGD